MKVRVRFVWITIFAAIAVIALCLWASHAHAEAVIPELTSRQLSPDGRAFSAGAAPKGRSLVFNAGTRWKDPKAIPHCWVNPEEGGEIVQDIERKITAEYARAGIGFIWEGKCWGQDFNRTMIRTWFKRSHNWLVTGQIYGGAGLSFLGAVNDNLGGSDGDQATMNIEIARDVVGYAPNTWRSWTQDVTRATAVHEFGHAMGLAHEQERRDAPICQDIRGNIPNGGEYVFVGAYDRFSIMNYCVDPSNINSLSDGDLNGLWYLYPKLRPQAVVSVPPETVPAAGSSQPKGSYTIRIKSSGLCLDLEDGAGGERSGIKSAKCSGKITQAFFSEPAGGGYFWLKSAKSGRCIDIFGASKANGSKALLWECMSVDNQRFSFVEKETGYLNVKAKHSGKCLDMGDTLQQWGCAKSRDASEVLGFFPVPASKSKTVGVDAVLPGT